MDESVMRGAGNRRGSGPGSDPGLDPGLDPGSGPHDEASGSPGGGSCGGCREEGPPGPEAAGEMLIDCDRCSVRGDACADCVVSVLLGPVERWDATERTALAVLAGSGLVPPLRLLAGEAG